MATFTIRKSGGGDYTSVGAAAAGTPAGSILSIMEAGVYPNEVIPLKATQAVQNNSGGVVTLQDVPARATYMIAWATGAGFSGVTIEYGSNYVRCADGRGITGMYLTDCILRATGAAITAFVGVQGASQLTLTRVACEKSGAGTAIMFSRFAGCTGTFTATQCHWGAWGNGYGVAQLFANVLRRCRGTYQMWVAADPGGTLDAQDCEITGVGEIFANNNAAIAAGAVSLVNCSSRGTGTATILYVGNGGSLVSATIRNCYATSLARKVGTGTWGAATAGNNSYVSSELTGPGDWPVAATADWKLRSDGEPSLDSPLLERGVAVAGRLVDLNGRAATQGRGPCIGPIQPPCQMRSERLGRGRNGFNLRQRRAA